jgi:hypothetical protein
MIRGKSIPAGAAIAGIILVAGCAGTMSADECVGADWRAIGEADGATGKPVTFFEDRAKDCESHGYAVDHDAYLAGREASLAQFCTASGGFEAGNAGLEYDGVCPAEAEPGFLSQYALGARLFTLNQAYETAVADLDSAAHALEKHYYNLRVADNRFENPNLNAEDRETARQDFEYHRREIARIEYDIPKMNIEIERTRNDLAAFREELAKLAR